MFTKQHLENAGFVGFIPILGELGARLPSEPCTYVVVWGGPGAPMVTSRSTGGFFKGKNPRVDVLMAQAKLVPDCPTLYIGRAGNGQSRVELLARFGRGEPVGHWGGRYLWQLDQQEHLLVAWRTEADPITAESELLDEFEFEYGQLPYANLVRGRKRPLAPV
jgi:hypothetical protein